MTTGTTPVRRDYGHGLRLSLRCYISAVTSSDPTALPDPWQSLHKLLAAMDAEIEQVYIERGIKGCGPGSPIR